MITGGRLYKKAGVAARFAVMAARENRGDHMRPIFASKIF